MKVCGGVNPHSLYLGTSWRWVVSITPWPLHSRERVPSTHCIGGLWVPEWIWMIWRSDNFGSYWYLNCCPLVIQPVANHYTDCATLALAIGGSHFKFYLKQKDDWCNVNIKFSKYLAVQTVDTDVLNAGITFNFHCVSTKRLVTYRYIS
jgi:hypothetical protein